MKLIGEHIILSSNAMEYLGNFVQAREYSAVFVLADENTRKYCLPQLRAFDYIQIEIRSGEEHKHLDTCEYVWDQLLKEGADRNSLLINLGGGVIGDLGGFCAATFMRGIQCVDVPTTLLAMVDASIGGKTGVDYKGYKNYIGLFAEPESVFIHPDFLNTLPERQLYSGFAEMLKHGLIADAAHWNELQSFDKRRLKLWIETSLNIKKQIVEEDFLESGVRKILNFGHTFGHAIESMMLERETPVLHGEAVAAGMIMETVLSHYVLALPLSEMEHIIEVIDNYFPRLILEAEDFDTVYSLMKKDKKNDQQHLRFSLIPEAGKCLFDIEASEALCLEAFTEYL